MVVIVGEYTARGLRDRGTSDQGRLYPACLRHAAVLPARTSAVVVIPELPVARWCRCLVAMSVHRLSGRVVLPPPVVWLCLRLEIGEHWIVCATHMYTLVHTHTYVCRYTLHLICATIHPICCQ